MEDENKKFITKDLYFAALLYALGVKLLGNTRVGSICWFEFDDHQKCNDLYTKYISKELKISAKSYEEALKTLKSFLFNGVGQVGSDYEGRAY